MSFRPREMPDEPDVRLPDYYIHKSETDEDGNPELLNFSSYSFDRNCFPDYTAERKERKDGQETWIVRNSGEEEIDINSGHGSLEELAYKLENVYEAVRNQST